MYISDIKALLDAELERSKVNSHLEQAKIEDEERARHVRPWDKGKGALPTGMYLIVSRLCLLNFCF